MPQHGPPDDRHGLFGKIAQGGRSVGRFLLDAANDPSRGALPENVPSSEELSRMAGEFGIPGDIAAARSIPGLLGGGHPIQAGIAALSLAPGIPRLRRGLFQGLEELQGTGLRVFARSEGPGLRTVASITPNPKAGGGVKVSLFEESAQHGASVFPDEKALSELSPKNLSSKEVFWNHPRIALSCSCYSAPYSAACGRTGRTE